ncbi:hypothetical protein [Streptomyces sp. NPDC059564]|uniref:hypothetical protein n=1 Tax=Streptomyces sp. NPDC059564 TaxID=3346865 RepID=UPI0036746CAB
MDLPAMSPNDVDATYSDLADKTQDLKSNAVDESIQFNLNGNADLSCSAAGCNVTAHVTAHVTATAPNATVTGGQVQAEMTASVQIDGQGAGGCTQTASLSLNGTSDISCFDGAAGPVFAADEAQKKAQAQAQSSAQGGVPVEYTIASTGQAFVTATAQVDVSVLVQKQKKEQQQAKDPCGTGGSAGQGSGPYNCALVSPGNPTTATVSPQKLLADAKALHDAFGVGSRADKGNTIATGQLGGHLVYSVSGNRTSEAVRKLADKLGYRRIFATDLNPGLDTDAEQILFNAIDEHEEPGDGIIAASRPACGADRQNCADRGNNYPNIELWDQRRPIFK